MGQLTGVPRTSAAGDRQPGAIGVLRRTAALGGWRKRGVRLVSATACRKVHGPAFALSRNGQNVVVVVVVVVAAAVVAAVLVTLMGGCAS